MGLFFKKVLFLLNNDCFRTEKVIVRENWSFFKRITEGVLGSQKL